jgi:orotidine-5'-phosphate decarboxylase
MLAAHVAQRESQLVLGLDPDPSALWPGLGDGPARSAQPPFADPVASAVLAHCTALIGAAAPACVAIKPQLACFERLGHAGRMLLGAVLEHARQAGLLVIADGKRGDIDVSARAYAQALYGGLETPFGRVAGLGVDAATVNPLMGRDALEPFVSAARARGAGVLALVRTSNPGAADVQDLELAGGGAVWERLAGIVDRLGRPGIGARGLSDVGAVVGATVPAHLARARELMPNAVLLLPGVGAQGGRVQELAPAFSIGPAGGLVSASRSIAGAYRDRGGDPALAARAEAERLRALAWELA